MTDADFARKVGIDITGLEPAATEASTLDELRAAGIHVTQDDITIAMLRAALRDHGDRIKRLSAAVEEWSSKHAFVLSRENRIRAQRDTYHGYVRILMVGWGATIALGLVITAWGFMR